jgi:NADH-quinone oxidoreductase subunit G
MCLVEVEKSPKPVASCAMPIAEGMVVHTDTPKVKKAREGVMELLLINHPLDCPICDQGGECDLQDQAFKYGRGGNRFAENKRSVKDKYMGPLVKTQMTRCIHCTRCIRFSTEVAGVPEMGAIHRGEHTEITTYLEKALSSELSGNLVDICPVGALTSKPYAFKARSWELKKTESIDVMDALGSNIRIDSRGLEVMRVLPKINDDINEEWLSDKGRYACDGLKYQRLDRPYVKKDGKLVPSSWEEALTLVESQLKSLKGSELAAIAGTLVGCEAMFLLKELLLHLGSHNIDANQFGYKIDTSSRSNYLFNTTVAGIEKADLCLLIGANPRHASPVLNARIGKMQRSGALKVFRIGSKDDQTYKIEELGDDLNVLTQILNGSHHLSEKLKQAKHPMFIIGDAVLLRSDGFGILSTLQEVAKKYKVVREDWNGFNILHNHASMVGSLDVGFTPGHSGSNVRQILSKAKSGDIKFVYLLGADEIDTEALKDTFVVYQGHHGDTGANVASVILPAAAYTEQDAIYVNLEGRPQYARAAVPPPGKAKEDWVILKDLLDRVGYNLPALHLVDIRREMSKIHKMFGDIDRISKHAEINFAQKGEILFSESLLAIQANYYMTDPISRSSITMAKCLKERNNGSMPEVNKEELVTSKITPLKKSKEADLEAL